MDIKHFLAIFKTKPAKRAAPNFVIGALLVTNCGLRAQECGPHEVRNIPYTELKTLPEQDRQVIAPILENMVRFDRPEGSGFILTDLNPESVLVVTASHVARMESRSVDNPERSLIGFPARYNDVLPESASRVPFTLEFSLNRIMGARLLTPTVLFKPSENINVVYSKKLEPWQDFTIFKAAKSSVGRPIQNLKWGAAKLGHKVYVIGQDTIASGCIDQTGKDSTFEMDALVEEGMSGGAVVDAESGAVVGVLTTAFYDSAGTNLGSGAVSLSSIVEYAGQRAAHSSDIAQFFEENGLLKAFNKAELK